LKGPRSVRRPRKKKRAMFSISFAKYRPHRPHRLECGRLQGFLAVGTKHCLSTARDHYRPLSKVPPAYRSHRNLLFSGCSMPLLTTAVDAVATLRVLSRWFVLLGEVRLCVYPSAETISMHLPSDYIYPYRCVGGSCSQRRTPRRGRDNGTRRRSLTHLKLNYWISARPLLVRRTSSPITVMFSSRPTIRLMLPGIAPPAR
jgi:hypothetical protein